MEVKQLSETQKALVEHMRTHPYSLMRMPGGIWTTTDCQRLDGLFPDRDKWWGTKTVTVLLKRGIIRQENAGVFWRGRFRLTVETEV